MEGCSQYSVLSDSGGKPLKGGKNYQLHLLPDIPANNFWSMIVYDSETRLIIKTDQPWPSVYSSCQKLVVNHDGSLDVWFCPKAPSGRENNWIQTIPGKEWYLILRLYDPMKAWLDGIWKPGQMEPL